MRTAKRKTGSTGRSPAPDLAWQQGVEARFASDGRKIAARGRQVRRGREEAAKWRAAAGLANASQRTLIVARNAATEEVNASRRSRAALQETVKELSAENERLRSRLAAAEACMLGERPPGRIARAVRDLGLAVEELVASLEQAK